MCPFGARNMKLGLNKAGLFFLFCAALLRPGCSQLITEPIHAGFYDYTSYDKNGVAVVGGWFTMSFSGGDSVSGEWHFKAIGTPGNIGPQTGNGTLAGKREGDKVWVDLSPQFRDNNLLLDGKIDGNRYSGSWSWISFIGVTNQGTFEATRK